MAGFLHYLHLLLVCNHSLRNIFKSELVNCFILLYLKLYDDKVQSRRRVCVNFQSSNLVWYHFCSTEVLSKGECVDCAVSVL